MHGATDGDPGVVANLLALFLADQEAGRLRAPRDYATLFPGHEETVERELARLRDDTASEADSDSGSDSEATSFGRFVLVRELGRGGQGTVWLARDGRLGREVALKLLHRSGPGAAAAMARFRREAAIASRLDHPGICTVFDAGVEGEIPWIAMRFVRGESLAELLRRGPDSTVTPEVVTGPESATPRKDGTSGTADLVLKRSRARRRLDAWLRLFEQLAWSLHDAHEAGVVHRDIKPANIMVTPERQGVIMDFGLAQARHADLETLTLTGEVFGTPAYMSPEQLAPDRGTLDRRTDLWSLGVTLYECVTGRRPFEGATREALYQAILGRNPPHPSASDRSIPRDLGTVLSCALEKDRERRYASAAALARDLAAVREGRAISVRPVSWAGRALRWMRRSPGRAALVGTLAVAILTAAGLGGYLLAALPEMRLAREQREADAIERLVDSGLMSLFLGDRTAARTIFEDVLHREPRNPDAIGGLVASQLRLLIPERPVGFRQAAVDAGETFARFGAVDAEAEPELGWIHAFVLRERGETDAAEALEATLARRLPKTSMRHLLDAMRPLFLAWYGDRASAHRALQSAQAAVARSPRPRLAHYWVLGEVANYAGQPELAKSMADAVLDRWPDSAEARLAAGIMLLEREYLDESKACLEESIRRDPGSGFAWSLLAERKAQEGEFTDRACEAGLPDARRAVEIQPSLAYARFRLSTLLYFADRLDEALLEVRAALSADPEEAIQHLWHARILEQIADRDGGNHEPALEAYETAVRNGLHWSGVHFRIARVLAKLGRFDEAEAAIPVSLRYEPANAGIYAWLTWEFARAGRLAKAREFVDAMLAGFPARHQAWNLAAWFVVAPDALPAWRDPETGLQRATKANELAKGRDIDVLNTLGVALYRNGRFEAAITALRDADRLRREQGLRRTPADHAFLALALHALGRDGEAEASLALARSLPRFLGESCEDRSALREADETFGAAPPSR